MKLLGSWWVAGATFILWFGVVIIGIIIGVQGW